MLIMCVCVSVYACTHTHVRVSFFLFESRLSLYSQTSLRLQPSFLSAPTLQECTMYSLTNPKIKPYIIASRVIKMCILFTDFPVINEDKTDFLEKKYSGQ